MSIRNLERLFKPRSMALIGASKEEGSLGAVLAHNLFNAGFAGPDHASQSPSIGRSKAC